MVISEKRFFAVKTSKNVSLQILNFISVSKLVKTIPKWGNDNFESVFTAINKQKAKKIKHDTI